jgi:hypothetical protein
MNFVSNLFNYFYNKVTTFKVKTVTVQSFYPQNNINNIDPKGHILFDEDILYIFINTANIHNASELFMNDLEEKCFDNKYIKIYLLKSNTLEPLYKYLLEITDETIDYIKTDLSNQRKHLHTFIDAIQSHIEFNNIKNYHIYY